MSDRQNLNLKMRFRVKVIVFGTSLHRFTVYPDCIIRIPWQTACGKPFYTSTSASEASLTALRFLLQRSNCMVWYDTCQCNCKSQLHHPFSSSEASLNSVVGRSPDELSQRHAPCLSFTPQRLGSKPSTWPKAFGLAIFILDKDRQTGPAGAGVPEMNQDWLKQWSAAKEYA